MKTLNPHSQYDLLPLSSKLGKKKKGQNGIQFPDQGSFSEPPIPYQQEEQLSPIEQLMKNGIIEPQRQDDISQLPVGPFEIPQKENNGIDWSKAALTTLLGADFAIPTPKPKAPIVQPQTSYSPNQYGTGSQAIAKYGIKMSNSGYKATSADRHNSMLQIPSNQITMEGVPHNVFGVDDLGYSMLMQPGKNYKFPGTSVLEIPMKAQNGAVFQTQEQIDKANIQAKRFALARGLQSGEATYVAKNIGDPIPQITNPDGSPFTPFAAKPKAYNVPLNVNFEDIKSYNNAYWYNDPTTGDIVDIDNSVLGLPRFKVAKEKQEADRQKRMMATMKSGGKIGKKKCKDGGKLEYLEGQTYTLNDQEIQDLLDEGYELQYEDI